MTSPELRLVPALPEHVDMWRALREEPVSRRLVPLEPSSRESLLKRLQEATHDLSHPTATNFRWMVEWDGRLIGTVAARELSRFHVGFTHEGVMRGHYLIEGRRKDQQFWGLLRPEWEARQAHLTFPFARVHGPAHG